MKVTNPLHLHSLTRHLNEPEDSSARTLQAIERNLPDSGFIKGGDIPSAADIVLFDLGMIRMDEWMRTIGGIHVLGLTIRWCVVAGTSSFPPLEKMGVDVSKYPKVYYIPCLLRFLTNRHVIF